MSDTPPAQQGQDTPAVDGAAPRKPRVLIVDATELGGLLQGVLARGGLDSVVTRTATAALDAILADAPELAIVDVDLPDASGVDLLQILQQPPARIPVILVSNTPREALPQAAQMGAQQADGFFQKPLHTRQLMDRVSLLLGFSMAMRSTTPAPGVAIPQGEDPGTAPPAAAAYTPETTEEIEDIQLVEEDVDLVEEPPAPPPRALPPPLPRGEDPDEPTRPRAVMPLPPPMPPPSVPAPPVESTPPVDVPAAAPVAHAPDDAVFAVEPAVVVPLLPHVPAAEAPRPPEGTPPAAVASSEPPPLPPATLPTLSEPAVGSADLLAAWRLKVAENAHRPPRARAPVAPPATQGEVATTPLHALLDAYFAAQESGTITLQRGAARRRIQVNRGWVTSVQTNVLAEQFGNVVAQMGLLDKALLEDALRGVDGKQDKLPGALLQDELLDADGIRSALSQQRERVLRAAFAQRDGTYAMAFGPPARSPLKPLFPGNAILRGVAAAYALVELRTLVPADIHLAPRTDGLYPLSALDLTADEARLVIACDGTKSVEDLLALSDLDEQPVLGILCALQVLKLVRPVSVARSRSRAITYF